ncbi:MAG: RodZ domain-containing protein [Cyanobacteria bacterium P01_A01_bin.105]
MKQRVHSSEQDYQDYREQLLVLGDMLRQARLAQGRSLQDVAHTTLIRQPLLVALETASMDELPEPVYVRGLLRRYGDTLGLDGATLASQYFARPVSRRPRPAWSVGLPQPQLRPYHLYGAYVLLIAVSVSGLSYLLQRTTPEAAAPPILDPAAVEQLMPEQAEPQPPSEPEAEPAPPLPLDSPVVIQMELTEQSWVRIVADGQTEFEGILQQGDSRSLSAEQSITIRAGNAGGVVVSYNANDPEAMGKPGMVAERTFSPDETISMNLSGQ